MKTLFKSVFIGLIVGALLAPVVQADPPRRAPAYGYRYQFNQDHRYRQYRNYDYRYPDYNYRGNYGNRCGGAVFGTVLGTAVGGMLGSQSADNRAAGTITGMFVGAVVGSVIGSALDEGDRGCADRNSRRIETPYRTWRR